MTRKQYKQLRFIIKKYGEYFQVLKAIEECSELSQALCRVVNETCEKGNFDKKVVDMIDEIADVAIMLEQLKIIFHCHDQVKERIDFKINRQLERIKAGC